MGRTVDAIMRLVYKRKGGLNSVTMQCVRYRKFAAVPKRIATAIRR